MRKLLLLLVPLVAACGSSSPAKAVHGTLSVSPSALDFGRSDGRPAALSLSLRNDSAVAVHLSNLRITDDARGSFSIGQSPQSLAAGASANLDVHYAPPGAGADGATLIIDSDAANAPELRVSMVGQVLPGGGSSGSTGSSTSTTSTTGSSGSSGSSGASSSSGSGSTGSTSSSTSGSGSGSGSTGTSSSSSSGTTSGGSTTGSVTCGPTASGAWSMSMFDNPEWPTSVWGTGPSDVWIGAHTLSNTALYHWDGSSLGRSFYSGFLGQVMRIRGTGPNDVWAVTLGSGVGTTVLHWDGSNWTSFANLPSAYGVDLAATRSSLWMAAEYTLDYRDGGSFTELNLGGEIWNVVADDGGQVWAGGTAPNCYPDGGYCPLVAYGDGSGAGFATQRFDSYSGTAYLWQPSAGEVWLMLDGTDAYRWNGSGWSYVARSSTPLGQVGSDGTGDTWFIASAYPEDGLEHFNGCSFESPLWYYTSVNASDPNNGLFFDVWGSSGQFWAVGQTYTSNGWQGQIWRYP